MLSKSLSGFARGSVTRGSVTRGSSLSVTSSTSGWSVSVSWGSIASIATVSSEASASSASASAAAASFTVSWSSGDWLLGELLKFLGELGEWRLEVLGLAPKIWGKVLVGLGKSLVGGLDEVLSSSGMSSGLGVAIINTGELKEFLGNWGTDDTGSSWGWNKLDSDGGALSGNLSWDGMDGTELVSPETSSDWNKLELGGDEGTLDGNLDFLGDLDSKTDVTVLISDNDDSLEAGSLTGHSLLLNRDDLHDFVGDLDVLGGEDGLNNLSFLDGDGVSVDLLEGLDLSSLH